MCGKCVVQVCSAHFLFSLNISTFVNYHTCTSGVRTKKIRHSRQKTINKEWKTSNSKKSVVLKRNFYFEMVFSLTNMQDCFFVKGFSCDKNIGSFVGVTPRKCFHSGFNKRIDNLVFLVNQQLRMFEKF